MICFKKKTSPAKSSRCGCFWVGLVWVGCTQTHSSGKAPGREAAAYCRATALTLTPPSFLATLSSYFPIYCWQNKIQAYIRICIRISISLFGEEYLLKKFRLSVEKSTHHPKLSFQELLFQELEITNLWQKHNMLVCYAGNKQDIGAFLLYKRGSMLLRLQRTKTVALFCHL